MHLRPRLNAMLGDSNWCVDSAHRIGDEIEIIGWAIAPADGYFPATFTLDGVPFAEVDYPRVRPDIGELFWFRPGAEYSGFVCRTPLPESTREDGFLTIDFVDRRTLGSFTPSRTFHLLASNADDLPVPEADRRVRVHGNDDAASFMAQGASAFVKLDRASRKSAGKGFTDFRRVLDWGCGCGRVTRYFARHPEIAVRGIDIDESNIEWCRENLPFAQFDTCAVDPPTLHAEDSFDLIFGISVMTHLGESDRAAWLAELSRVAEDGALVLLTVQGASALCRSNAGSGQGARWEQTGMIDVGVSISAEDLSPEPDRYIDCFLTDAYIRDQWSEHFDVVEIMPGYIGNAQDLVILRNRKP